MGIMDTLFGAAKPAQVQSPANVPAGTAENPNVPGNTTPRPDGSNPSIPGVDLEQSPLAKFDKLWDKAKEGQTEGVPNPVPNFNLDPAVLKSTASSIDFTAGISAEKLSAAFPGSDPEAVKAILNEIGQASFVQNFSVGAKTMETAITKHSDNLTTKTIPELLRRQDVAELNRSTSELYNNPATAPMMQMLEKQFTNRYPAATPQEIANHSTEYMNAFLKEAAGEKGMDLVARPKANPKDTDWSQWAAE